MKWVDRACFFMICTNETEKECLERGLFGDQEWLFPYLKVIKKGDIGFLINISKDEIIGIFEAVEPARLNIVPEAWGGKFPAQIKVRLITRVVQRIDRASLKLKSILELKEIKRDKFAYKIPKQKTYGPDVTNKVLGLFKVDDDFYLNLEMYDDLGLFPQYKLEDVAGLGEVKKFIYQRVIAPFEDEELASKLRLKIGGGMLLFGPPGTGKTLIAMAIANHIQAKFIDISPSVIIGYPGEAEKRLENIFHELEKEPRAVLFLDEAEWILCRREDQTSSVMQRVTPVLLSQLGRIFKNKNKPIIVIAATNKPQMIDSAFLRPGRFDKLFYIGLPDEDARVEIIKMQLRDRPHDLTEAQIKKVAKRLEGYSGADIEQIIEEAAFLAFESKDYDNDVKITIKHINEAIDKTPKSVSEEEVRSIEEWARMRNVIE
jgi:SpoVK/Ycf46/Vps4 family AAA+-type ATPase